VASFCPKSRLIVRSLPPTRGFRPGKCFPHFFQALGFKVTLPLISFLTIHIENTLKSSKCKTSLENPPFFFFKVSASVS
jgi:hypothetical protein